MPKLFKTKDLYLASYLFASGQKLASTDKLASVCWFYFDDQSGCSDLATQYWVGNAQGNIKSYVQAVQALKDIIFAPT